MTEVTLELVQAKQAELEALIARLTEPQTFTLCLPAASVVLHSGEHYAGAVLDAAGHIQHHLVLMAQRPDGDLDWNDATAWAESVGGTLPNCQEQALLYANCKPHLQPVWHWSSETHESEASYAGYCYFTLGYQGYGLKSAGGAAVAVRRVTP